MKRYLLKARANLLGRVVASAVLAYPCAHAATYAVEYITT